MNRMACSEACAAMKACFVFMSSPPIERKKPRRCVEPQPPPSAACYPGEAAPVQRPRRFLRRDRRGRARGLKLEPPGLQLRWRDAELKQTTLLCVAPGSDSRATDCSLYSGENRGLVCFVISSLQVGIQFTAWSGIREQRHLVRDPGATSSRGDIRRRARPPIRGRTVRLFNRDLGPRRLCAPKERALRA